MAGHVATGFLTAVEIPWTDIAGTAVTILAIAVAAFFALRQLREAERSRYAALAADLTRRWDEPLLREARRAMSVRTPEQIRDLLKAHYEGTATPHEVNEYYALQALPNFIEGIAAVEEEFGGLSIEFVNRLWGGAVLRTWEMWAPAIEYVRENPTAASAFENFELLVTRLTELRARQT